MHDLQIITGSLSSVLIAGARVRPSFGLNVDPVAQNVAVPEGDASIEERPPVLARAQHLAAYRALLVNADRVVDVRVESEELHSRLV